MNDFMVDEELKKKMMPNGRIPFYSGEQLVYEWEQNLEEVLIYIKAPDCVLEKNKKIIEKNLKPGMKMPKLQIIIKPTHVSVGLEGLPPYLSEDLSGIVKPDESLWELDDGEIIITLQKALRAGTWESVFKGHNTINQFQKEEFQKKMLKERFQEQHPGFDFSDAEINGNVPDPQKFMGGYI
ncbi:MAG: NudC domain-containing protein [archaeon]|nr:NudC domain-containing protein [archaeon]